MPTSAGPAIAGVAAQRVLTGDGGPRGLGWALGSVLLLGLAVAAAWWGSLAAPFLLDDHSSILENATLRSRDVGDWLTPPGGRGETVGGRPLVNLTLKLNHAFAGYDVRWFRATNVLIHWAAAVALMCGLRVALVAAGSRAARARWVSLGTALLWAVHPLQVNAVTYVVQRTEALAALAMLLSWYAFIQATTRPAVTWRVAAVVGCWVGAWTKESTVVVPVVALIFDAAWCAGSFRRAWQVRGRLYLAMASSWAVIGHGLWAHAGRGGTVGASAGMSSVQYLLTQAEALVHYLSAAVWPHGLVFDFGAYVSLRPWPSVLLLGVAGAGLAFAARRRGRAWLFFPAGFLTLLAPTSSVVPITTQTIAEHRMYLPLAFLLTAGVLLIARAVGRRAWLPVGLTAVALAVCTLERNRVFRTEVGLWTDTVAKMPSNVRAHHNRALALQRAGAVDAALQGYREVIRRMPHHAFAQANAGNILFTRGEWVQAREAYEAAVAADPTLTSARLNLGIVYARLHRFEDAEREYRAVLAREPDATDARANLAALPLLRLYRAGEEKFGAGDLMGAAADFEAVVRADPRHVTAHARLGRIAAQRGDLTAAARWLRAAVALAPSDAATHANLGNVLLLQGDAAGAAAAYEHALALNPGDRRLRESLELAREALRDGR